MMAIERTPFDNYLAKSERPETSSKFSRNSRRSDFHMTFTDLASNLDHQQKASQVIIKKGDTQSKFYNSKTKFPKTQSFSSTFYPSDKHQQKPPFDPKGSAGGTNRLTGKQEIKEPDSPSKPMTSLFTNADFKQGVTLDQVLGGQFKKIDIFDTNNKEFEKMNSFDERIDEITNEASEIEEKEYQYESFEILETDDEEDTISELHKSKEIKDGLKSSQPRGQPNIQENHEVLSRIQNKYKSSKPKYLPKTKPKRLRSRSPLKEKVEEINTETVAANSTERDRERERERERVEVNNKRERVSSTRTESKSSSPKFGYGQYPARFPSFVYESNHHANEVPPTASSETVSKELVKNSSSPGQFATQTSFRGASSQFTTTNENFRNTNEKFRTSFMKKTVYGKPMNQFNPSLGALPEKDQNSEKDRTGSRSNSLAVTVRQTDNVSKFVVDKTPSQVLEQKFMRENKNLAQKIKQSEKEMMDKYTKMFKLDQKEMIGLYKDTERRYEGSKRLSTPMKDFNTSRTFQKRKIVIL